MSSEEKQDLRKSRLVPEQGKVYFKITEIERPNENLVDWLEKSKERLRALGDKQPILCVLPIRDKYNVEEYVYPCAPCGSLKDLRGVSQEAPEYTKDQFTVILIVLYHVAMALDALHQSDCVHRNLGPGSFLIWKKKENDQEMFIGAIGDMAVVRPLPGPIATCVRYHKWMAPEIREELENSTTYSDGMAKFFEKIEELLPGDVYGFGWVLRYMFSDQDKDHDPVGELALKKRGLDDLERELRKIAASCMEKDRKKRIEPLRIARWIKTAVESAIPCGGINEKMWKASTHPQNLAFQGWELTSADVNDGLETLDSDSKTRIFENAFNRVNKTERET